MDEIRVLRQALERAVQADDDAAAREIARRIAEAERGAQLSDEQRAQAYAQPGKSIDPSAQFSEGEARIQAVQRRIADATGVELPESIIAGGASLGAGLVDIYEGGKRLLGLGEGVDEEEARVMQEIEQDYPISSTVGRVAGQTLPFVAGGPAVAAGGRALQGVRGMGAASRAMAPAKTFAGRAGQAAAMGATEGAAISAADKENRGIDIASGAAIGAGFGAGGQAAFEGLGRVAGKLGRRIKMIEGNEITEEGQKILQNAGIDATSPAARRVIASIKLRKGEELEPDALARMIRFEEQGIPYTRGDILGGGTEEGFKQKTLEARLFESAEDELAQGVRDIRRSQSAGIQETLERQINKLGGADDTRTGQLLKEALTERKGQLNLNKADLYRQLAEEAENAPAIPVNFTGRIDWDLMENIADSSDTDAGTIERIRKRLLKNGIGDPDEVAEFAQTNEVNPLNIARVERLRQYFNDLTGDSARINKIAGQLKSALDEEMETVIEGLQEAGVDTSIGEIAKAARAANVQIGREFSPQSIVGKLTDTKRDRVTDVVNASDAIRTLFPTRSRPKTEDLTKVVESLSKAGGKGKRALNSMRGAAIMRMMDNAFKQESNRVGEQIIFSGNQFAKAFDEFGNDNLEILFKGDKAGLNQLRKIRETANDLRIDSKNVPKGSASFIGDALNKLGITTLSSKIPGINLAIEGLQSLADKAAKRKQAQSIGKVGPKLTVRERQQLEMLKKEMPNAFNAAGLSILLQDDEENVNE